MWPFPLRLTVLLIASQRVATIRSQRNAEQIIVDQVGDQVIPQGSFPEKKAAGICPENLFNFIEGTCVKVLVANANARESTEICKKYARENNLPEKDVNMGLTRTYAQIAELLKLARADVNITKLRNEIKTSNESTIGVLHDQHMWIGIYRDPDSLPRHYPWKNTKNGELMTMENFGKGEPNFHLENQFCVYMYLENGPHYKEGTWNDHSCTMKNAAVLCEYLDFDDFEVRFRWNVSKLY